LEALKTDSPMVNEQLRGLTEQEAIKRREQGQGNNVRIQTGRTYAQIVFQNFFTFINCILFGIGFVMVLLGLYGDAFVSVGVVMLNVIVSLVQETRAKRQLDQIALLTRPKATVIRDGQEKIVDPSEIVIGDMICADAGDQIVVDGAVVGDGKMDVDESLLTGESDLVSKKAGDEVFSGSFCVSGRATYEAQKVGVESFANKLTITARQFRIVRTPLQKDINLVVRLLLALATVIGVLFIASFAIDGASAKRIVQTAAVIAGLVPAGLILMTATSYAIGAVRMSGKGALVQRANAVESMSNVNVLCLDKTGTLTANRINLAQVVPLGISETELKNALGDYARSTRAGNRTSEALKTGLEGQSRKILDEIPFSSARKWSALTFDEEARRGVYVLGAPEMVRPYLTDDTDIAQAQIDQWLDHGMRVLLVAHSQDLHMLHDSLGQPRLPGDLQAIGLVSFSDELRPEAKETLDGFLKAGIRLKIISGDNPYTVAALAKQAGLADDIRAISGTELEAMSASEVGQIAEDMTIFGRITPQQKEMLVQSLQDQHHYVAMIGDGVNDVLSLKKAHIGIAMQSGSAATRGVADIVLLGDSFAALPKAFMEGQRILNGMGDIIRLFLTRAFYAALIIIGTAIMMNTQLFPFIPKHASLLTLLTVGFPTFGLAAWAHVGVPEHHLVRSTMRFAIPAALLTAAFGMGIYFYYILTIYEPNPGLYTLGFARTALTTFLVSCGLVLIVFAEPPTPLWVAGDELSGDWRPTGLALLMFATFILINAVKPLRVFFELEVLRVTDYIFIATIVLVWTVALRSIWRSRLLERFIGLPEG